MLAPSAAIDTLALLGGVLLESGRMLADRLRGDAGLPTRAAEIDPSWLEGALNDCFPGVRVATVTALDSHAGTTDRARIRVEYADPGRGEDPPSTLFVKTSPTDAKTRLFVNLMGLGAGELGFYREIAAAVPIERPRAFHLVATRGARGFVLLLEDLEARGARFLDSSQDVTLEQARAVVRTLARLQAAFWDSPRLRGDLAWLRAPDRNPHAARERCLCALSVAPTLRRFGDLIPEGLRAAATRIAAARPLLERAWARGPRTLLHGDAHVGNMYLLPDAVGLLDWQVVQCGQGMRDVTYFLATSVPTALRRAHERDLLDEYRDTLGAQGVAAPDREEVWSQYRLHALYASIATVVTTAAANLQAEHIARAGLARSSAVAADLESVSALDRLER